MSRPSSPQTREFEGEQWVRKRDYDQLATEHSEHLRNTKAKLQAAVSSILELVPDLNTPTETAEATAHWQLTRITGRSLSSAPGATVQVFRVELPADSSSSSSNGNGGLFKYLPLDAAVLCSTDPAWSGLSDKNKARVKKKVDNLLSGAGTKVAAEINQDQVKAMLATMPKRPEGFGRNAVKLVDAEGFMTVFKECYRYMHKLAVPLAAAAAGPEGADTDAEDADDAGDEADVVSDELIQSLGWLTACNSTKVVADAWVYTKL